MINPSGSVLRLLTEYGFVKGDNDEVYVKELKPARQAASKLRKRKTVQSPAEKRKDSLKSSLYKLAKQKFEGRAYNREKVCKS